MMEAPGIQRPIYGRRGMPSELADAIYADYLQLKSCAKVASKWGRTRQAIHEVLKRRARTSPRRLLTDKVVIWNGEKFTPGKGGYLRRTMRRGHMEQYLHRIVWAHTNGPIPEGYQVMFKDGDKLNCDLSNLECLPLPEVSRRTATGANQHTKAKVWAHVAGVEKWILKKANFYAQRLSVDAEDLAQVGRVSAARSARSYRAEFGAKFLTYAHRSIASDMLRAAKRAQQFVSVPVSSQWDLGLSSVALDAPISDDADSATFADVIADESTADASESADTNERFASVVTGLEKLRPQLRAVLRARFFEQKTLREIAEEMGVSHQRVQQIEAEALRVLRQGADLKNLAA
jgi:RNA polymerase sigma factor FliA